MYYFLVRIELHGGLLVNYNTLHQAMIASGFKRTITANDGVEYHLPTAEYVIYGNYNLESITSSAKSALAKTGHTGMILVSQSTTLRWEGLTQVA